MRLVISTMILVVLVLGNMTVQGQQTAEPTIVEPTPSCIVPGIGNLCTPTPTATGIVPIDPVPTSTPAATITATVPPTPSCIVPGIGDLCTPTPTATPPPGATPTPTEQPQGQGNTKYWLPAAYR